MTSSRTAPKFRCGATGLCAVLACAVLAGGCAQHPPEVTAVLAKAGDNRGELESVLRHYRQTGDPQKLRAAEFLIANMRGHAFARVALMDAKGKEIPFDVRDHKDFGVALKALKALGAAHGKIEFKSHTVHQDIETITADRLIENIDLAFEAWRTPPWTREVTFETFCEYVLPYRCSQEPLGGWRSAWLARQAELTKEMKDPADLREAWGRFSRAAHGTIGFRKLYYLHPTDQSFEEMQVSHTGRCEDITNMVLYAARANGVPCASDYVPFWPHREGNHNWEVVLDAAGRAPATSRRHAAKVFRKTFSMRPNALRFQVPPGTSLPRWLGGVHELDVTDQYTTTSDVSITLDRDPPRDPPVAYLCVFNSGGWRPIYWGLVRKRNVTFARMGRSVLYLPAYYVDKKPAPAGPPIILNRDGSIRTLEASQDPKNTVTLRLLTTRPPKPKNAKTAAPTGPPFMVVQPERTYELFVWSGRWQSQGKKKTPVKSGPPVSFENIPSGGLYILIPDNTRGQERPFTIENGARRHW